MKELVLFIIIILSWLPSIILISKLMSNLEISESLKWYAFLSIIINCAMSGVFWILLYSKNI